MLDTHGYDVAVADTAAGALAAVRDRRPDVILLDLYMPGTLTGAQALKALAACAPVIIVTSSTDEALGRQMLAAGAFDYVTKPFTIGRIVELVEAAVHGRDHG